MLVGEKQAPRVDICAGRSLIADSVTNSRLT